MPIFDMECPRCKKTWEALIVKETADNVNLMCEDCCVPGKKQIAGKGSRPAIKILGYAARNGYGLKKFTDPEKGWSS